MTPDRYKEAFFAYLEGNECAQLPYYLFTLIQQSFAAGWQAAGGELPDPLPLQSKK